MSFQQGLSGLSAASQNLSVIGNNVANSGTFGFKESRTEFADMYAAALNGAGSSQVGIGVTVAAVAEQFTQGNITATGNPLDMAINGGGFFQVQDSTGQTNYTRNGQFKLDRNGYVVTNGGDKLLGYPADGQGVILPGKALPLQLPTSGIAPNATSKVQIAMNLNSNSAPIAASTVIDASNPKTFDYSTSATLYDSKGQDVAVTYFFRHSDATASGWDVYAQANGTWLGSGTASAPAPISSLTFDSQTGALTSSNTFTFDVPATTNASTGANVLAISGVTMDLTGATSVAANDSSVTSLTQDGYASGQITGVTVDDTGVLLARYSNGQSKAAGQLVLAEFRNPQGLQDTGNNQWRRTFASGDAVEGTPGNGNMGALQAGSLEESNVDLTAELVSMITAQRDYQANAQTIKTMDQAMQTLVNLR